MSFCPVPRQKRKLKFRTYDLEWLPGSYSLRIVGEFDGQQYRSFTSVVDFLNYALTRKHRGMTWFAHAGGLADVQFLIFELMKKPEFTCELVFSGSSAIKVTVMRGNDKWFFRDSFWLLRDSLANIAKSLGTEKGGKEYRCPSQPCGHEPGHCIFYAPLDILREYNAGDCKILHCAISRLADELEELGGSLKGTIASCAMHLYRAAYQKTPIDTSEAINEIARKSYIASRVEVFRKRSGKVKVYDINSSFPHSMSSDLPGSPRWVRLTSRQCWPDSGKPMLCHATVCVPERYLPMLPYRCDDGGIYHPTGTFQQWFTRLDLDALERMGGRILSCHGWIEFEPNLDMREYVRDIYGRRKREKDGFRRIVYKYLLNSLYGKTAERGDKELVYIHPDSTEGLEILAPGIFAGPTVIDIPHAHVPIATYVTARSRQLLTGYLEYAEQHGDIFYADTDSVVTTATMPTSDELGQLKLEKEANAGYFVAPKCYLLDEKVKAKGFSRITKPQFEELARQLEDANAKGIEFSRMVRLRESFRGELCPRDIKTHKAFRGIRRPKRAKMGENDTRPWTVEELERKYSQ